MTTTTMYLLIGLGAASILMNVFLFVVLTATAALFWRIFLKYEHLADEFEEVNDGMIVYQNIEEINNLINELDVALNVVNEMENFSGEPIIENMIKHVKYVSGRLDEYRELSALPANQKAVEKLKEKLLKNGRR